MTGGHYLVIWLTVPLKSQHIFGFAVIDMDHNHSPIKRRVESSYSAMLEKLLVFFIYYGIIVLDLSFLFSLGSSNDDMLLHVWTFHLPRIQGGVWESNTYILSHDLERPICLTGSRDGNAANYKAELLQVWLIGCTASDHLSWLLSFILTRTLDVTNVVAVRLCGYIISCQQATSITMLTFS